MTTKHLHPPNMRAPEDHLRFSFGGGPRHHAEFPEAEAPLPRIGEQINGRYEVVRKVGQGQFGWVYLVRHMLLDQRFAMKIMNPKLAEDDSWVTRFREEARLTSLLGHEGIVFVTDFDRSERFGYYFVMEYLKGVPLSKLLKMRGPMKAKRAFDLALKTASALAAVHDVGITHRDLKPSNIMVCRREDGTEQPKVLDFGISSSVIEAAHTRKLYGTPAYMAPEQTRTMDVDGRADQFSLACVLYELLTGRRPWKIKKWREASAKMRRTQQVIPPSQLCSDPRVDSEVDAVIMRALELDWRDRWRDMDAFCFALRTAAGLDPAPMSDPTDMHYTLTSMSMTAPSVTIEPSTELSSDSVVVLVDDGKITSDTMEMEHLCLKPVISMNFRSTARLKREWMRNLRAGGLFVPSAHLLPLHASVKVQLILEEEQLALDVDGEVVSHQSATAESPGGFGVSIAGPSLERARQLIRQLELEITHDAHAIVTHVREMRVDDELGTGEAFLMSRLSDPLEVQKLRSIFSGLPFVLDEVLHTLAERGLVHITNHPECPSDSFVVGVGTEEAEEVATGSSAPNPMDITRAPWLNPRSDESTGGRHLYNEDEIEQVLELVEYFKRSHNYMGAIHALRKAIDVSPTVGEFYRQLALLHARFKRDMGRANRAIEAAIQLEPSNESFKLTRDYLHNLERLTH